MDHSSSEHGVDSIAPVQVQRTSVEDEVAQMNRGKGRQITAVVAVIALSGLAGTYLLRGMDAHQRYEDAIVNLDQLHKDHADAHLQCVLENTNRSLVSSADKLHQVITRYSERHGAGYARRLTECAPTLAGLVPALNKLQPPKEVDADLRSLRTAATDLQRVWDEYRAYLASGSAYDEAQASPRIDQITSSWSGYQAQRVRLERDLRGKR
jgi:hypothetical protein